MREESERVRRRESTSAPQRSSMFTDDRFYRALADARRRRVLAALLDGDRSIDELATLLAGWDAVETGRLASGTERDRARITLRHVHLPLLVDAGLITHDAEDGTVSMRPIDDDVERLLRRSVAADASGE